MASGRLSLAEQIAQFEEAAPVDYDPEDVQARDLEAVEDTQIPTSTSRGHYVEVGPSSLRNALPSTAEPKYEGVRTSRKDLMNESDEDHQSDAAEEDMPDESTNEVEDTHQHGVDSLDEDESCSPQDSDPTSGDEPNSFTSKRKATTSAEEDSEHTLPFNMRQAREDDICKGQAIKRQLTLWDTLLDTRIRLQKAVVSANTLPPPSYIQGYLDAAECQDAVSKFLDESTRLYVELDSLQESLLQSNKIISPPPRKRQKLGDDASVLEYSEAFRVATEDAAVLEESLHPYVLQTLSKWSAKIQAVAPSALISSNRGAFLKGNQQPKSAVQQIDEFLSDNSKILERTRTSRTKNVRIGVAPIADTDEPDPEIFDDTDFYQKMLRDIIDSRKDGNRNEDWMLLQKQKKAKKKVDTRASKGRKLRFEVHEKLQNFMVPVPVSGAWHDEQIDELFSSLLGKGFESIPLNAQEPHAQEHIELSGFRVFG